MNRYKGKAGLRTENGAAMVEAVIVTLVFLMLLFGILEFAMLIFKASSLVEATRAGARYLIVNDPVVDLSDYDDCDELASAGAQSCGSLGCGGLIPLMQNLYEPLSAGQVYVQYRCSNTGFEEAYFNIYEVEVSVRNAEYRFVTPGILGLNATVTLPDFATSRLSEDLNTIP